MTCDALSRLREADHGHTQFTYGFDLAGNLVNLDGVSRTYDAANRLIHDGTQALTYDANGNLTNDGTSSYTWDRANRLLSHGGHSYAYDGDGRRISQTVSSVVTKYLLDTQPGLSVVLSQTVDDTDTTHYVHGPRGLHAVQQPAGEWMHPVTDGLGSVRGYVDPVGTVLSTVHYTEVGVPSTSWDGWAFTGEWRDANALQHHRARYYAPGLAVWTALDPWEGLHERPMSLNGYSWVEGNPVNLTDASGEAVPVAAIAAAAVALLPLVAAAIAIDQALKNYSCIVFPDRPTCDDPIKYPTTVFEYCLSAIQAVMSVVRQDEVTPEREVVLGPVWYSWLHPLENPYATPRPTAEPWVDPNRWSTSTPVPTPTSTPTLMIRVRHYSNAIWIIRNNMAIGRPGATFIIWAEYPITTPRRSPDLELQYDIFRPGYRLTGIVEFNVDTSKFVVAPDSAFIRDPTVNNAVEIVVLPNLARDMSYLETGFRLSDPGVDPEFFDPHGNPLL